MIYFFIQFLINNLPAMSSCNNNNNQITNNKPNDKCQSLPIICIIIIWWQYFRSLQSIFFHLEIIVSYGKEAFRWERFDCESVFNYKLKCVHWVKLIVNRSIESNALCIILKWIIRILIYKISSWASTEWTI